MSTKTATSINQVRRLWVMNAYLIAEDDGLTLIDTTFGGGARGFLDAAAAQGSPIRRVLLTHAHADHAGSLDELLALSPEIEFICGARTARYLAGDMAADAGEPQDELKGGFVTSSAVPVRTVADGDRVGSLQVVASPGHSPDHVAFFDTRDGTLYAGDAFQTQGGLAVAGDMRWRFPLPALATWHRGLALESARRLLDLAPTRLAPGHGPILDSPQSAMTRAIQRAERKFNDHA